MREADQGHQDAFLQPWAGSSAQPGDAASRSSRHRPGRSLLRAGLSRGDPSPGFPLASARSSFLPLVSPASAFLRGGEWPARRRRCCLVLGRVFVPAAVRPLQAGGRHGRLRLRSHGAGGERTRLGPGPGALSCPPWRFPVPGDAAPGARDLSRGAEAQRSTCNRAAFVYGGPAFGRSTRPPRPGEEGGQEGGEGPRRGRGRPTSPTDPTAAPESQARLPVAASRDSPGRDPRAPGLEEIAVSAQGARRGPALAGGSRDLGARRSGGEGLRRERGRKRYGDLVCGSGAGTARALPECPAED